MPRKRNGRGSGPQPFLVSINHHAARGPASRARVNSAIRQRLSTAPLVRRRQTWPQIMSTSLNA